MKIYVTEEDEVIYTVPEKFAKKDVLTWYRDENMTVKTELKYENLADGGRLYGVFEEAYKEITLVPKNGGAPYTATVDVREGRSDISLPTWQGYELVGWYADNECTGESVTLDFESVTDGGTYYAKWIKIN